MQINEELQELREEPKHVWIKEHRDELLEAFVENNYLDEFNAFCEKEFYESEN